MSLRLRSRRNNLKSAIDQTHQMASAAGEGLRPYDKVTKAIMHDQHDGHSHLFDSDDLQEKSVYMCLLSNNINAAFITAPSQSI